MNYDKQLEIKKMVRELLDSHGLTGWMFQWGKSKRRFGCCKYAGQVIEISYPLASLNTIERVRNTVIHEIAHALVGPYHNHDRVWKMKAYELGIRPDRCFTAENTVIPKGKYIGTCPNCKKEQQAHRRRRRLVACGACCKRFAFNRFDSRFVISWRMAS